MFGISEQIKSEEDLMGIEDVGLFLCLERVELTVQMRA